MQNNISDIDIYAIPKKKPDVINFRDSVSVTEDSDTIIYHLINCNCILYLNKMKKDGVDFYINKNFNTPLIMSLNQKNAEMVEFFLKFDQYLKISDINNGNDLITISIKNYDVKTFKVLYLKGLNFNRSRPLNDYSITPLYEIIREILNKYNHPWMMKGAEELIDMLDYLLTKDVDPFPKLNIITPKGKTKSITYDKFLKNILKLDISREYKKERNFLHNHKYNILINKLKTYIRKHKISHHI